MMRTRSRYETNAEGNAVLCADEVIVKRSVDLGNVTFSRRQTWRTGSKAMLQGEVEKWATLIKSAGMPTFN